ncbi:PKD domain-containing protein [Nocardioides taihuensis]|uniref:PKD domain-containing protein n=1 Tax=Nocardioides taihuensis TaxID=1835606 RepID=A0ABW0BFD4_9ACTN
MNFRTLRAPAVVAAAAVLLTAIGAAPAVARPAPAPTGLAADVTAHEDGTYDVAATWNAVPTATSYRVALSKGSTTLASTTVATAAWSPTVTAAPGNASLSVRAVVGRKPGKAATLTVPLADVTAPQGSYSSSWDNGTGLATITQDALSDNAGLPGITRTVDWGDATIVDWPSGSTITHTYTQLDARYAPTVTLQDAAGNVRVVDVPAVDLNDVGPPTGSFSAGPATGWADLTEVTVTQADISDDRTPPELIARSVDWGDGTTTDWSTGTTVSHVYATAGQFTPTVTLTDEADNSSGALSTSEVVVTADTTGPTVRLTLPKSKHSVKAWKTLRGKAVDSETGVKKVSLRAVEKRGSAWYGYNAGTKKWLKASTQAKAFARSKAFALKTDAQHRWSATLAGLRKGTLVYKVRAKDRVGNASPALTHQAKLSRR